MSPRVLARVFGSTAAILYNPSMRALLSRLRRDPPFALACLLVALALAHGLLWPILAEDNDLWIYLNAARRMARTFSIPKDTFFSFVAPPRPWVDYSWLLQALAGGAYASAGYHGLIALKAILYAGTCALIALFLLRRRPSGHPRWYPAALLALFVLGLAARFSVVRPHMLTYLMIPAFLYVLEFAPERLVLLPLLALIWMNAHGIAYPILLCILGAYSLERLWLKRRSPLEAKEPDKLPPAAALCALAVLATPCGWRVLPLAWTPLEHVSGFIQELAPFAARDFFFFSPRAFTHRNALGLLLLAAAISAIRATLERRLRLSHLLLFSAALVLLAKGQRLAHEAALLCLPLLASHSPLRTAPDGERLLPRRAASALAALFILGLPASLFFGLWLRRPAYPMTVRYLPTGTVAFLKRVDTGGRLLNFLNSGGYLSWSLGPRYTIFMDMNVPNVFTPADAAFARAVYAEPRALERVLADYAPDFISAPLEDKAFPRLIAAHPRYALVFFDDVEALYADRLRHPGLAARYALSLDPFRLSDEDMSPDPSAPDGIPPFLARMLEIDPACLATRLWAARIHAARKDHARLLELADSIRRDHPDLPAGDALRADALSGLGRREEALGAYRRALRKSDPPGRASLLRRMAAQQLALGRAGKAYALFRESADWSAPDVPQGDLYRAGSLALAAGRDADAAWAFGRLCREGPPGLPCGAFTAEGLGKP